MLKLKHSFSRIMARAQPFKMLIEYRLIVVMRNYFMFSIHLLIYLFIYFLKNPHLVIFLTQYH